MTEPSYPTNPGYYAPPQYGPAPDQYGGYYAGPPAGPPPVAAPPSRPMRSGPGRLVLITLLLCLGAALTGVAVPSVWGRSTLLGTDRFVDALAPLAGDDGVQQLVIDTVSTRIESSLGAAGGPLSGGVDAVVRRVVTGPAFPGLWRSICRVAHPGVVAVLTGDTPRTLDLGSSNGRVTLDVGPVIAYVQTQLAQAGIPVSGLPTSGVLVSIADLPQLDSVQTLINFNNDIAWWLPFLALIAFALAIAVARGRLRVVQVGGVLVALAMLVDLLIVSAVRSFGVDQADGFIGAATAGSAYDTVAHGLRADIVITLVVALVIAAAALVAELVTRRRRRVPPPASRSQWS